MNAKETIKYLYENGHIIGREHYKTIYDELTEAKDTIKHLKLECGFLHKANEQALKGH